MKPQAESKQTRTHTHTQSDSSFRRLWIFHRTIHCWPGNRHGI